MIAKEQRQTEFISALCLWIADAGLPFSLVDNKYFKEVIKCSNQDCSVPSRQSVTIKMSKLYDRTRTQFNTDLNKIPGMVSITTDACSSRI